VVIGKKIRWPSSIRVTAARAISVKFWVREGAGFPGPGVRGGGGGISGLKRVRKGAWEGPTG
jgi:hypothetical protein